MDAKKYMVELFVAERKRLEEAFLKVTILEKSGFESMVDELVSEENRTSPYLALRDYLKNTTEERVIITDDFWNVEQHGLENLLEIIPAKDIEILLYVNSSQVELVNDRLYKSYKQLVDISSLMLKWKYHNYKSLFIVDRFLFKEQFEYSVKVYQDGSGVIALFDGKYRIHFFDLGANKTRFVQQVTQKIDKLVSDPLSFPFADDRWGYIPIRIEYNVFNKEPIDEGLWLDEKHHVMNYFFYDKESDNKDMCLLLKCPEVRKVFDDYVSPRYL